MLVVSSRIIASKAFFHFENESLSLLEATAANFRRQHPFLLFIIVHRFFLSNLNISSCKDVRETLSAVE